MMSIHLKLEFFVLIAFATVTCVMCTCYPDPSNFLCVLSPPLNRAIGFANMNWAQDLNSNEWCMQLCKDVGFTLSGTQGGGECYCGSSLHDDAVIVDYSECNIPCTYNNTNTNANNNIMNNNDIEDVDANSFCGGVDRLSLSRVNCTSTTPTPPPPSPSVPFLINPCVGDSVSSSVSVSGHDNRDLVCNASLSFDDRSSALVDLLTVDEKINSLGSQGQRITSIGLEPYNWWNEASHGVASGRRDSAVPSTTNFALPITTAMSFNRTLWQKTGQQIGLEARALMNLGYGYSTFWAPVVNLARDPRWGRNIETPGEDPYLSGEYATYYVRGVQELVNEDGTNVDDKFLLASASCKHFVGNEMEHSTENGVTYDRRSFNSEISMRDLVDSYLPPFQACVQKGRVSSLMCSYNRLNGVPSCANSWLLSDVARSSWGFDGYIVADCDAVEDIYDRHNYTSVPEEAVRDVLRAGMDVDCGGGSSFIQRYGGSALSGGYINMSDIDSAVFRSFRVRMRLGHFDDNFTRLSKIGIKTTTDSNRDNDNDKERDNDSDKNSDNDVICSPYAIELASDAVLQSITLVKNINSRLPLTPPSSSSSSSSSSPSSSSLGPRSVDLFEYSKFSPSTPQSAAVIGPNSMLSRDIAGYYGPPRVCGENFWTVVDAVSNFVPNTSYAPGVASTVTNDTSLIAEAVELAKTVDLVVLVVGTDLRVAAEGYDASSLSLSPAQQSLVSLVAAASKYPVVVVLMTAVPLDISNMLMDDNVAAILHAGQPSVQTSAIGRILFGVSPSGRLVQTIYPSSFADEISIFDFNMRPGTSKWPRPDCDRQKQKQIHDDKQKRDQKQEGTAISLLREREGEETKTMDEEQGGGKCVNGTNPGRTYRFYTGKPVLPFGFGLSYTTFNYSIISSPSAIALSSLLSNKNNNNNKNNNKNDYDNDDDDDRLIVDTFLPMSDAMTSFIEPVDSNASIKDKMARLTKLRTHDGLPVAYAVNVTNTGSVSSSSVVLSFVSGPSSGTSGSGSALSSLFGFERIRDLAAGASVVVWMVPQLQHFTNTKKCEGNHENMRCRRIELGDYTFRFGIEAASGQGYATHTTRLY